MRFNNYGVNVAGPVLLPFTDYNKPATAVVQIASMAQMTEVKRVFWLLRGKHGIPGCGANSQSEPDGGRCRGSSGSYAARTAFQIAGAA
jgi:hypothetical protein